MNQISRKSAAQWAELVASYTTGTLSERDFCKHHNVNLASLRKWRYHYKSLEKKQRQDTAFVKIKASHPSSAQHEPAVVCVGADIRVECPSTFTVASLAELALALQHGR